MDDFLFGDLSLFLFDHWDFFLFTAGRFFDLNECVLLIVKHKFEGVESDKLVGEEHAAN